jgi:chromosome segregation ATPase
VKRTSRRSSDRSRIEEEKCETLQEKAELRESIEPENIASLAAANARHRRVIRAMRSESEDRADEILTTQSTIIRQKKSQSHQRLRRQRKTMEFLRSQLNEEIERHEDLKIAISGLHALNFSISSEEIDDLPDIQSLHDKLSHALSVQRKKSQELAQVEARNRFIENMTTLFAGPFDRSVRDMEVRQLFAGFRGLTSVVSKRGMGTGSGFWALLRFSLHDAAEKAIRALNGSEFRGKTLTVCWCDDEHPA